MAIYSWESQQSINDNSQPISEQFWKTDDKIATILKHDWLYVYRRINNSDSRLYHYHMSSKKNNMGTLREIFMSTVS